MDNEFIEMVRRELKSKSPYIDGGWIPREKRSREVNDLAARILSEIYQSAQLVVAAENLYVADDDARLEHGVFYWEFERALHGDDLFPWTQETGDCVSFGSAGASNDCLTIGHLSSGGWEQLLGRTVATEPIYAGSRIEVGNGRLGRGAGSLGEWATKWLLDWGVILRDNYDGIDLSRYDVRKADGWGMPGRGCPDELEPIARLHPMTDAAAVHDGRTAIAMLVNLNPMTVASNMGFETRRRPGGICRPRGSWPHQMFVRGAVKLKDGNIAVPIQNSWGDYLGSGNATITTYSDRKVTLPSGCFLAMLDDIEGPMLGRGDCWAYRAMTGWTTDRNAARILAEITS